MVNAVAACWDATQAKVSYTMKVQFTVQLIFLVGFTARAQSDVDLDSYEVILTDENDYNPFDNDYFDERCSMEENLDCGDHGLQCTRCDGELCKGNYTCQWCQMGDYCPQGSYNYEQNSSKFICPEGFHCPNPTSIRPCSPGWFCLSGTFVSVSGLFDCENGTGFYCPEGSTDNITACPAGYYCPDSTQKIVCPENHFCKEYTVEPYACDDFSYCSEGSTAPASSVLGVLSSLLFGVFVFLCLKAVAMYEKRSHIALEQELEQAALVMKAKKQVLCGLLGIPLSALAQEIPGFKTAERPITISFRKMSLTMGPKVLLHSVSADFKAGRLIAVMGPSGCGKSTLLNTLCGKAKYGTREGEILINGAPEPLENFARVIGFVPQDDTVYPSLTVRENLKYSAKLRLPADVDLEECAEKVNGTLQVLGLEHIQNSIVGSVEKRGISGGQKKRVNIGVEFVADPTVCFLDEPTSGLGATDTLVVMKACRSMSFTHRSIISVIHQPRYAVFTLFHDVMLLGVGGHVVYFGPSDKALQYFEMIGFVLPNNENPADFFLDIISGSLAPDPEQWQLSEPFSPIHLFAFWEKEEERLYVFEEAPKSGDVPETKPMAADSSRNFKTSLLSGMQSLGNTAKGGVKKLKQGAKESVRAVKEVAEVAGIVREDVEEVAMVRKEFPPLSAFYMETLKKNWIGGSATNDTTPMSTNADFPPITAEGLKNMLEKIGINLDKETLIKVIDEFEEDEDMGKTGDQEGVVSNDQIDFEEFLYQAQKQVAMLQPAEVDTGKFDPECHPGERLNVSFFIQLYWYTVRAGKQLLREADSLVLDIMLVLFAGGSVGLILGAAWEYDEIPQNAALSAVTLGLISSVGALKMLGNERVLFWRERDSGCNIFAYFLGKNLVKLVDNIWRPGLFLAVYYNLVIPKTKFGDYWALLIVMCWATSGTGIMWSTMMRPTSALLAAVIWPLVTGVFLSGVNPALAEMDTFTKNLAVFSFTRWSTEASTIMELDRQPDYHDHLKDYLWDSTGYDKDNLSADNLALALMGLVARIIAYIFLTGAPENLYAAVRKRVLDKYKATIGPAYQKLSDKAAKSVADASEKAFTKLDDIVKSSKSRRSLAST